MQHYHDALKKARTNPKDTWNLLGQLVLEKSKQNKCNFLNPTISATTFNNFFAAAGEKMYNDMKQRQHTMELIWRPAWENTSTDYKEVLIVESKPIQAADVILAISKFKNTKSTGHEQINLQRIKESLMVTIPYITLIINTSIVTNVFPKPWGTLL